MLLNYRNNLTSFILLFMASLMANNAMAYSYAAAGKEPVIEGREKLLLALNNQDFSAVQTAYNSMQAEFAYFNTDHGLNVDEQMQAAITAKNETKILATMLITMKAEVMRRLEGAEQNINDYQIAKVLVVKSKLFIDLLASDLTADDRAAADIAIRGALKAIGNPGVFGVGQKPADKAQFNKYREQLATVLAH